MKIFAKNQRANYEYDIRETFIAGMVLSGPEVKSVKNGNISLAGSYVSASPAGAHLLNAHIGPYPYARQPGYNPTQTRQLLLNRHEINQLIGKEKGLVIIPLEMFAGRGGRVKIKIGLGRARKKTDKREYIRKRETQKEIKKLL